MNLRGDYNLTGFVFCLIDFMNLCDGTVLLFFLPPSNPIVSTYTKHIIQEWRQNSWGGWIVRQSLAVASHIYPFVRAVIDASTQYSREESPISRAVWYIGSRAIIILSGISFLFVAGKVLQWSVGDGTGNVIEVVQEVVIVHEYDTEEEAAAARAAQWSGKTEEGTATAAAAARAKQGRGKKQKQKAM